MPLGSLLFTGPSCEESSLRSPGVTVSFKEEASMEQERSRRLPKISKSLTEAHRNVLDCDLDILRGVSLQKTLRKGRLRARSGRVEQAAGCGAASHRTRLNRSAWRDLVGCPASLQA